MAQYPTNPAEFREKENRPGNEYDPDKKRVLYVEDLEAIEEEVTEVESRLMPETDNPLPYGLRVGYPDDYLEITSHEPGGGVVIPVINSVISAPDQLPSLGLPTVSAIVMNDEGFGILAFVDVTTDEAKFILYADIVNMFFFQGKIASTVINQNNSIQLSITDEYENFLFGLNMYLDYLTGALWFNNWVKMNEDGIGVWGDYYINGTQGKSGTVETVVDIRTSGGVLQKKVRSITYEGGIVTNLGEVSDWQNAEVA